MTVQELIDLFNTMIASNRWWSRFSNSQFIRMMAMFAGQIIYVARGYAERALPEGFISTATKRSSILAAAEDRAYVPRLIQPSTGPVTINNKTNRALQLPLYMTIWGENQYPYVLMDVVTLAPGAVEQNVKIAQMEKITITVTLDKAEGFYSILLPIDITAKAVSLAVYVTANGTKEKWTENPQFRLANSRSKNYVVFYKPTEQLGIRFGDGSIGMMPPDNCTIDIDVWTSEGDITLVQGQRLQPSGNYQGMASDVEILTSAPITGGAPMESIEEIRSRAMYSVAEDGNIIWRGDYKFYLKTKFAGITWINVWGEAEEEAANGKKELKNMNKIFISAHKPGVTQADMKKNILDLLNSIPARLNKEFEYYDTNELPFTVKVTGTAYPEVVESDAIIQIRAVLENTFGKDSPNFETSRIGEFEKVRVNDIWAAIQALGLLSEFKVEIPSMPVATKLFDFIYMDAAQSTLNITNAG